jgi:hypothetical protein
MCPAQAITPVPAPDRAARGQQPHSPVNIALIRIFDGGTLPNGADGRVCRARVAVLRRGFRMAPRAYGLGFDAGGRLNAGLAWFARFSRGCQAQGPPACGHTSLPLGGIRLDYGRSH